MATQNVTIVLKGALSHSVKLPGMAELKILKGRPHPTTDPRLVAYAKSRPQLFSVAGTLPSTTASAKAAVEAEKKNGGKKTGGKSPRSGKSPRGRVAVEEDEDE